MNSAAKYGARLRGIKAEMASQAHTRPAAPYQPKTGARCDCKRGQARDNCPACEGTGWRIDFAAIRARNAR